MHPYIHSSTIHNSQDMDEQPTCPSTDEQIKKMWYVYTMEYYSAMKNEIMPFAFGMDLEMIILSEVSQTNTI